MKTSNSLEQISLTQPSLLSNTAERTLVPAYAQERPVELSLNIDLSKRNSRQDLSPFNWQETITSLQSTITKVDGFNPEEYENKAQTTLAEDNFCILLPQLVKRAELKFYATALVARKHCLLQNITIENQISKEKLTVFLQEMSVSDLKDKAEGHNETPLTGLFNIFFQNKINQYKQHEEKTPKNFIETAQDLNASLTAICACFKENPEHGRFISYFITALGIIDELYESLLNPPYASFHKADISTKKAIITELHNTYSVKSDLNSLIKKECSITDFLSLKNDEIYQIACLDQLNKKFFPQSYELKTRGPSIEIMLELLSHYKTEKINYTKDQIKSLQYLLMNLVDQICINGNQNPSSQSLIKRSLESIFITKPTDQVKRKLNVNIKSLATLLVNNKEVQSSIYEMEEKLGLYWHTLLSLLKINDLDWHRSHNCLKDVKELKFNPITASQPLEQERLTIKRIEKAIWVFSLFCANNLITAGNDPENKKLAEQTNTRVLNTLFQYYINNNDIPQPELTKDEKRAIIVDRVNRAKAKMEEDTLLKEYQEAQRKLIASEAQKRRSKLWAEMTVRLNSVNFETHHPMPTAPQGNGSQGSFSKGKKTIEVKLEEREVTVKPKPKKKKKKKTNAQKKLEAAIELTHVNFASMSPKLKEQYTFLWTYANSPNKEIPFSIKDLLRFCNHFEVIKDSGFGKGDHYGLTLVGLGSYCLSTNEDEEPTIIKNQSKCSRVTIPIVQGNTRMNLNDDWHSYILKNVSHALKNTGYPNPAVI